MTIVIGLLSLYSKHTQNNISLVGSEIVILQKQFQIIENPINLVILTLLTF